MNRGIRRVGVAMMILFVGIVAQLTYLQVALGYIVARVLISWLFVPAYFQGEMLTAYELINRRFGSTAKHVTASLVAERANALAPA